MCCEGDLVNSYRPSPNCTYVNRKLNKNIFTVKKIFMCQLLHHAHTYQLYCMLCAIFLKFYLYPIFWVSVFPLSVIIMYLFFVPFVPVQHESELPALISIPL